LPRELPEISDPPRPITKQEIGVKRGKKVIASSSVIENYDVVDKRMSKITS
jgi:hypothetical protein